MSHYDTARRVALIQLRKGPASECDIRKRALWGEHWSCLSSVYRRHGEWNPELRSALNRLVIDGLATCHNGVFRLTVPA